MRIEPADDAMFRERDAWRYDPPYDFYNGDGLPVKNPELFFAVRDDDGALIGFYFFGRCDDYALFHGLGMRPDLTGRGLGEQFVLAGLEFSRRRHGRRRVALDVAAFNERAIRLYQHLGFTETGRHTETFSGYRRWSSSTWKGPAERPLSRPGRCAALLAGNGRGSQAPRPCDRTSPAGHWAGNAGLVNAVSFSPYGPWRGRLVTTEPGVAGL